MRMFSGRKYKSGTAWGLWLWTDVDSEYIVRLHLIKTPWFAVCLHFINKPDPEPWLHDHPVTFLSIILSGWYRERRDSWANVVSRRLINFIRADRSSGRHSICDVSPDGAVTLCFMGPKRQDWGFHTDAGWIYWKDYYTIQRQKRK